jgi:hypothetical protein
MFEANTTHHKSVPQRTTKGETALQQTQVGTTQDRTK